MSTSRACVKGSPLPPLENGKLRIYSMRLCPYAQRTRLMLHHKNIPFETVNINLKSKPEWFLERNPLGMVPVLEKDGKIVYESSICNEYLDEVYPNNPLISLDPYEKARDRILQERFNKVVTQFYKILRSQGKDKEAIDSFQDNLDVFEAELMNRGKFFGGDKVSNVDFLLWPYFERVGVFEMWDFKLDSKRFQHLRGWICRMCEVPAVKEVMFDRKTHESFYMSALTGEMPNYDIGL